LNQNGLSNGEFYSSNGRTSVSNTDYDNLVNNLGWYFEGLDLIIVGSGKLRVKGVNSGGGTTTTTTTTATPYYIYDFTSKVQYGDSLGDAFEKAGITDWDGIERFVATDLNTGTQVYYIGTDGDKHPIPNGIAISNDGLTNPNQSFINYLQISQGVIYEIYGDGVTFDSITPFVVTTTTTTTEAPTTTTTTTEAPSSYMFSIPVPNQYTASLYKFGWNRMTTTSGYWKFERTNDNGVYTSFVFGADGTDLNGGMGYGNFTFISCDVNGNPSGTITQMNLSGMNIDSFNGSHPDLSGLTRLSIVTNSITSLDVSSLTNLDTLFIAGPYGGDTEDAMTPQSNTDILLQLNVNGLQNGTFTTNGGRVTSQASESAYLSLINKGWTLLGLIVSTTTTTTTEAPTTTTTTTEEPTTTTTTVPMFNLTFENGLSDQLLVLSYFSSNSGGRRGPGNFGPSFTEYGSMVTDENGQVVFNGLPNDGSNWKIDVYNTSLQDGMVVYTTGLVLEPDGPQLHEDTTLTRNFYNVDFLNQDDSGILSGKDVDIYYIPRSEQSNMDVDIFPILMFSGTTDVNGTINTSLSDGSYIIRTYEDNGDLSWGQLFDVQGGTVSIYRPLSTDVEIVVNNLATTIWNNMVPTNNSPVEGIDIYYYDNSFEVYSFDPSQPIGNNNSQVIPPLTLLGQTDSNGQLSTNGTPVSIESGYIGVVWGSTDSEGRLYSTGRTESLINDLGVNGNGVKTITLDTDINIRWAQWHPVINLSGKSVILSRFNGSEWVPFDSYTSIADSTNTSFGYLTGGVEYKLEVYNTQTTGDIGYSETWTPTWGESKTTNVNLS
jgi:hypothetical protein